MDANQLAEAIARAVELAKPATEYCFLASRDYWWTVCMTKGEWSGWMQAIGAVVAILYSGRLVRTQMAEARALEMGLYARRMTPYAAIFEEASNFVQSAVDHTNTTASALGFMDFLHNPETFAAVSAALGAIQPESLESAEGTRALMKLKLAHSNAQHLVTVVSTYDDGHWATLDREEFNAFRQAMRNDATFALETIRKLAVPPVVVPWYKRWRNQKGMSSSMLSNPEDARGGVAVDRAGGGA